MPGCMAVDQQGKRYYLREQTGAGIWGNPVSHGVSALNWHVYIILCSDDTLYTGITTDVERRLRQHATGGGAKYFRGRQPKALLYLESGHDRSAASKREYCIKAMKRADKHQLIASTANAAYQVKDSLNGQEPVLSGTVPL